MIKIVKKFIDDLNDLVKDKNIFVKTNESAIKLLIDKGFNSKMGARPLQRTIDDYIKRPLSREILFGKLINGGIVEITTENSELKINFHDPLPINSKVKNAEIADN
jgi:ATP-dependent Clp protease ATP-binding subunit ClpA